MTGTNTNCAIQLLADATVSAKADVEHHQKVRDKRAEELSESQKRYENALRDYQQLSYALGILRNNV